MDALLLSLESQSLSNGTVKTKYSQVITCLDGINNGQGVGTVCSQASAQNMLYENYQSMESSVIPSEASLQLYRPTPNPFAGTTRFEGMEELIHLTCDPRALRDGYIEALEEYLVEVRRGCARQGIDYCLVHTGESMDAVLARHPDLATRLGK